MGTQGEKHTDEVTSQSADRIHLDSRGVAWIVGTNTKVIEVVLDHVACGWSPEEIHDHYPGLSLAQIGAALAFYREHRVEIDEEIEKRYAEVERLRTQATGQFTREELEARLRDRKQNKIPAS